MTKLAGVDTKLEVQFEDSGAWRQIFGSQEYDVEVHSYPDYWFVPYYILKGAVLGTSDWGENDEGCVTWTGNWEAERSERVTPDGWLWRPVFWGYRVWLRIKSWFTRKQKEEECQA